VSGAPEVFGELPMTCLAEEIETPGDGQIRALITVATNPVLSAPDGPRLARALEQLDFMVSLDIYLNETTRHADVILPGLSPLEDSTTTWPFRSCRGATMPATARPCSAPPGRPAEWQTLLQAGRHRRGDGAAADVDALDEAEFAQDAQRLFGTHADAVIAATGRPAGARNGCWIWPAQRALRQPVSAVPIEARRRGLTGTGLAWMTWLAKVTRRRHRPGAAAAPHPRGAAHPQWPGGAGAAHAAGRPGPRRGGPGPPAPDLVVIGRRDVRTNNSWMHNLPVLAKGPVSLHRAGAPGTTRRAWACATARWHAGQRATPDHRAGAAATR
jgi:anaerobic selenocysteine-containing dehydrogenase